MPELPEVETIKNVLKPIVIDKKILKIDILREQTIIGDIEEFKASLEGETFKDVTRIGKYLIFHLSNDKVFISHLRMEGKYFELDELEKNTYYSRVVFHLDNGKKICYDDSRCFGIMKLSNESNYKNEEEIFKLGPEPFDVKDAKYLKEKTSTSKISIKTTLLDQTLMTGLGNIYADEVLFATKIHPLTEARYISVEQWEQIRINSIRILNEAIVSGGSTIKSYHPGRNIDGSFQVNLKAYGKAGKSCPFCGHIMRFMKVNGRGTTYCPNCQKRIGKPIKIAIFGKIASGKSSVLSYFKNKENVFGISCDDIVHNIYENISIQKHIIKLLNLDEFTYPKVRKSVLDPKNRKKLESYIHPIVIKEIENIFKKCKKDFIVIEVPLLFEAKLDDMFDVIIGVDIDEKTQLERITQRDKEKAKDMLKLNSSNNKFDINKEKADFIISNNSSIDRLNKQAEAIFNKLIDRLN